MFIMEILELILTLAGILAIVFYLEMIVVQVSLFLVLNLLPLFLRITGTIVIKFDKKLIRAKKANYILRYLAMVLYLIIIGA